MLIAKDFEGGADHLLAMVALGLLAAQTGGRGLWLLPLAFVSAMVAGSMAGWVGLPFAGVEPMILASVVILGALVAKAARLPLAVLVPGVALFGLARGWAHGAEGPAQGLIAHAQILLPRPWRCIWRGSRWRWGAE